MAWVIGFLALAAGFTFRPRHTLIFVSVCVLIFTWPFSVAWFWGGLGWALWDWLANGVWHVTLQNFAVWGGVSTGANVLVWSFRWVVRSQRKRLHEQRECEPTVRAKRMLSSLGREAA